MKLHPKRNRWQMTGRYLPGWRLIADGGWWVGPGLGHFRDLRDLRRWVASQPARHGYSIV